MLIEMNWFTDFILLSDFNLLCYLYVHIFNLQIS